MERLAKSAPSVKLTEQQKKELAELDSRYAAKIAAREIAVQSEIEAANAQGNWEGATALQQQLASERLQLQAELEKKKDAIRNSR